MPGFPKLATVVTAVSVMGCGPSLDNPASQLLEKPEFQPEDQAKCKVSASQAKPLIVEWPSAERGELEGRAQEGVVIVSYQGCEMRLMPHCRAPVSYQYRPITTKRDRLRIGNEDELWATIPLGAARFEGKLAAAGELNVEMTMVGRYSAERPLIDRKELSGACDGATHALVGMTVGAFEFYAGSAAEVGAGAEVMGAGVGAESRASHETLTQDGDAAACEAASSKAPPRGCGALLRLEVLELQEGTATGGLAGGTPAAPPAAKKPPPAPVKPAPRKPAPSKPLATAPKPKPPTTRKTSTSFKTKYLEITRDAIRPNEKIRFKTGRAVIDAKSFALLDDVAMAMMASPKLRFEVGGHTDSQGSAGHNQALSQARADAVRDYLVKKGVPGSQVTAKGYGEIMPIASNRTNEGRSRNRRIEFRVIP